MRTKPISQKTIKKADKLRNVKGNLKAAIKLLEDSLAGGKNLRWRNAAKKC